MEIFLSYDNGIRKDDIRYVSISKRLPMDTFNREEFLKECQEFADEIQSLDTVQREVMATEESVLEEECEESERNG